MRISDWSSDVCSSDLLGADDLVGLDDDQAGGLALVGLLPVAAPALGVAVDVGGLGVDDGDIGLERRDRINRLAGEGIGHRLQQIGRASCRERVCQYV